MAIHTSASGDGSESTTRPSAATRDACRPVHTHSLNKASDGQSSGEEERWWGVWCLTLQLPVVAVHVLGPRPQQVEVHAAVPLHARHERVAKALKGR